jgi:hypothetical protein
MRGISLPGAIALLLTPLLVLLWRRLSPPSETSEFDPLGPALLAKRNGWLNGLFTFLMFVGLALPLVLCLLFLRAKPPNPLFPVGLLFLSFGLMVLLPVAVVACITLREGAPRFLEFWRFYELRWGIGLRGIAWVYAPIAMLVPIGLILMLRGS